LGCLSLYPTTMSGGKKKAHRGNKGEREFSRKVAEEKEEKPSKINYYPGRIGN